MREFCTSGSTEGPGRFPGLLDCLKGRPGYSRTETVAVRIKRNLLPRFMSRLGDSR